MEAKTSILILEDNPSDAELMRHELARRGCDFSVELARDRRGFEDALDRCAPDLVLADYNVPGFDGLSALALARSRFAEIPVIIVSGAIGEETAIETLKAGATDYVLKDRIKRIVPAVDRALREAKVASERKKAGEAMLRQAELIRLSFDAIIVWRLSGLIDSWNRGAEELYGYTEKEASGSTISALLDTVYPLPWAEIERTLHDYNYWEGELIHRTRKGNEVTVFTRLQLMHMAAGEDYVLEINRDITERKRSETALKESEERFRAFMDNSPGIAWIKDEEGRIVFLSRAFETHFGMKPEDVIGKTDFEIWPEDHARELRDNDMAVLRDGRLRQVTEELHVDGSEPTYWLNSKFLIHDAAGKKYVACNGIDITERKGAEDRLRRNEIELGMMNRTLKALSDSNQAMMRMENEKEYLDTICRIIIEDCGHSMVWIGFAENDEAGTVRPIAQAGFEKGFLECLNTACADTEKGRGPVGTVISAGTTLIIRNIGTNPEFAQLRDVAKKIGFESCILLPLRRNEISIGLIGIYSAEPDPFPDKEVQLLSELAEDLSYGIAALRLRADRAKAEEAVIAGRNLLQSIIDNTTNLIYVTDSERRFVIVNKALADILGHPIRRLIGKRRREVLPEETAREHEANEQKAILAGKPIEFEEYANINGADITYLSTKFPLFDIYGKVYAVAGISTDISERKAAENVLKRDRETFERLVRERSRELVEAHMELEKSKRLSDIGLLAATVAHELRNPLAAITMAVYNMRKKAKNPDLDRHLDNIGKKVNESSQIIDNLLFYSSIKPSKFETVSIIEVIEESVEACLEKSAKKVSVIRSIEDLSGVKIEVDPTQMKEVLNNILNNAIDSIPGEAGEIAIESRETDARFVRFGIRDNGEGMAGNTLARAFDPFFTTKARGTGLGLTVCRQILDMHGGSIDIESKVGIGTTVKLALPRERKEKR